jgi:thiol:disulfide interchange protein DsbD
MAATPLSASVTRAEPELLAPESAFRLSAQRKDAKTLGLEFKIADGYYMYRKRFRFSVEPQTGAKLGPAKFSKGKMKQDPTFGMVETYRDSVRILLPMKLSNKGSPMANTQPLKLIVTSQGCADAGVCFPPVRQAITLPALGRALLLPADAPGTGSFRGALSVGAQDSSNSPKPLPGSTN